MCRVWMLVGCVVWGVWYREFVWSVVVFVGGCISGFRGCGGKSGDEYLRDGRLGGCIRKG